MGLIRKVKCKKNLTLENGEKFRKDNIYDTERIFTDDNDMIAVFVELGSNNTTTIHVSQGEIIDPFGMKYFEIVKDNLYYSKNAE